MGKKMRAPLPGMRRVPFRLTAQQRRKKTMEQEKPATEQSETMPAESVSLILMPATVLRPILCFLVRLLFQ